MTSLVFREPNPREIAWIRTQWLSGVVPKSKDLPDHVQFSAQRDGTRWSQGSEFWRTPEPKLLISPVVYRGAARLIVDRILANCSLTVVDLASVPGEPVGWVAWDVGVVHYVRVLGDARRNGIGTLLLGATGQQSPSYSFMTKDGAALLAAMPTETEQVA